MTARLVDNGRLWWRGLVRAPDIDVVLALIAFMALLVDPVIDGRSSAITPLAAALALLTSLPLIARRRFPFGVLATVVPLLLVCLAVFHPNRAAVGIIMLVAFTVALQGGRLRSLMVGALMAPVVTVAVIVTARHGSVGDVVAYFALVLGAVLAGETLRARQALQEAMAEEGERERSALAQHRFDEERLELAHEVHDIVGHTLVAINVRASAAAHLERRRSGPDTLVALDEIRCGLGPKRSASCARP